MASSRSMVPASAIRVVVIDDDDFEREFLVDLLQKSGFNASGYASAIGVTNHLIQEHADVVVLDVLMPAIRGDRLALLLRKSPALQHLRMVLVSSLSETEAATYIADARPDAFVSKANVRTDLPKVLGHLTSH